ncbi:hypothetical protein BV25DRAFT_1903251 [Artomyces pyxidatus]|uniref:Uncharacterized protein n=1 Tax=Artomyces pyxidatus TaxID=48021 RepID=A0ACB8SJH2_9AGAM|nr:hypothetical protein BV25DRAFT_1903251 [Artomyces pyxidatus]
MLVLPDDVLLEILENLNYRGVLACQETCHRVRRVVLDSVSLEYKIELGACGMVDGARGKDTPNVAGRLKRLRLHTEAWRSLAWTECTRLPHLRGKSVRPYAVVGSSIVFPMMVMRAHISKFLIQQIPSMLRGADEKHSELAVEADVRQIHIDHSQDFYAFPELPRLSQVDQSSPLYHMRSILSGDSHPLACSPASLDLGTNSGQHRAACDVFADHLLDIIFNDDSWTYLVTNWKTGVVEWTMTVPPKSSDMPCRFLDDNHIIFYMPVYPDRNTNGHRVLYIQVYQFKNISRMTDAPATSSYSFALPALAQDDRLMWPRIASTTTFPTGTGYFHSDQKDRLLFIQSARMPDEDVDKGSFSIDIPLQTFRSYIKSHPAHGDSVVVPWDKWGPSGSRAVWLGPRSKASDGLVINGMRRLTLKSKGDTGRSTVAVVLDYHPRRVARALARQRNGDTIDVILHGGEIGEEFTAEGCGPVKTTLPCIVTEIPIPKEVPYSVIDGMTHGISQWLCDDGIVFARILHSDSQYSGHLSTQSCPCFAEAGEQAYVVGYLEVDATGKSLLSLLVHTKLASRHTEYHPSQRAQAFRSHRKGPACIRRFVDNRVSQAIKLAVRRGVRLPVWDLRERRESRLSLDSMWRGWVLNCPITSI